jgi:peptidoglycan/xylan/chitin deacetylase (PgdA/CDA1 family)
MALETIWRTTPMPEAYMTIDDSPSPRTGELLEYLESRRIQALFFCRGDFIEIYPEAVQMILSQGHLLGNHLYSHQPCSNLGLDKTIEEIERTQILIEQACQCAGIICPGRYLRFPYLDRGDGDKTEQRLYELAEALQNGSDEPFLRGGFVDSLQDYLHRKGYKQPFPDVNHPLYNVDLIRNAADCLLSFTSYDWMLSPRHIGKHNFKTVESLKENIDKNIHLLLEDSVNIVLFHDDKEGVIYETCELIDHMLARGLTFREYVV